MSVFAEEQKKEDRNHAEPILQKLQKEPLAIKALLHAQVKNKKH